MLGAVGLCKRDSVSLLLLSIYLSLEEFAPFTFICLPLVEQLGADPELAGSELFSLLLGTIEGHGLLLVGVLLPGSRFLR